jgi:hypothetical protein
MQAFHPIDIVLMVYGGCKMISAVMKLSGIQWNAVSSNSLVPSGGN